VVEGCAKEQQDAAAKLGYNEESWNVPILPHVDLDSICLFMLHPR
jgi:hypothetical protein